MKSLIAGNVEQEDPLSVEAQRQGFMVRPFGVEHFAGWHADRMIEAAPVQQDPIEALRESRRLTSR
jgi:hypothetical protein